MGYEKVILWKATGNVANGQSKHGETEDPILWVGIQEDPFIPPGSFISLLWIKANAANAWCLLTIFSHDFTTQALEDVG